MNVYLTSLYRETETGQQWGVDQCDFKWFWNIGLNVAILCLWDEQEREWGKGINWIRRGERMGESDDVGSVLLLNSINFLINFKKIIKMCLLIEIPSLNIYWKHSVRDLNVLWDVLSQLAVIYCETVDCYMCGFYNLEVQPLTIALVPEV